ncbi:MAG: hypothetical protein QOF78_3780 [Phycisphaerales bacterium]|jgi:hypothetical protein|nr:hypothetical protein [Phycisphaerales bacterium]
MSDHPIIDEIHRIREQMLADHGGDLRALAKHSQRRSEEAARTGRRVVSLPPRRPKGWIDQAKKAG